jgi:hypothetical protein
MVNARLNNALLRLSKRAEAVDRAKLVETFVDTGTLLTLLSSKDHQVIFGRRGTGKTHALLFLADVVTRRKDIAVYIDMRSIGSTGGLYADATLPLAERATRLLADTLCSIHEALLTVVLTSVDLDIGQLGPPLDLLASAATEVIVKGPVDQEILKESTSSTEMSSGLSLGIDQSHVSLKLTSDDESRPTESRRTRSSVTGEQRHRVHFGAVGASIGAFVEKIGSCRLWVLLDEWSAVPIDLQPYLADLIRRALLPVPGLTMKIGAIEQRSNFQIAGSRGDYVGIELGADISADLNLDDFMVFDNEPDRATHFFRELLFKHYKSVESDAGVVDGPTTSQQFVSMVFTQKTPFEELVTAAEGVPRDAINVLSVCAQRADKDPISIVHVRSAAKAWYQRDKEAAVSANPKARSLLHWIQDKVIAHRRARAFLIRTGDRHDLIDALFDSRVLHLVKRSVSAHDQPGVRYDVYKIDYGCYVDLLTTQKAPQGLLALDTDVDGASYIDVPPDDYRAIRRAILDLAEFERSFSSASRGPSPS